MIISQKRKFEKKFEDGTLALDDAESIGMFSNTFAMEESLSRKYLEHLEYIRLKKKRSEGRKQKKQEEVMRTNEDFDWIQMFHKGTLAKLDALNMFLGRHHLAHGKINKKRRKYIQSMHG